MKRLLLGFCAITLALCAARPALAEAPERGFVIKVVDHMVYLDLGRRDSVQVGDLFSITGSQVFSNPLNGDTLAVTPRSVGTVRVRQVFEKMSIAEVIRLDPGEDPLMMRITPLRNPEEVARIEEYLHSPRYAHRFRSSRWVKLVPGLTQWRNGQKRKGVAIMTVEGASLAAAIGYRSSSNDWKDQYDRLPAGLPAEEYQHYFHEADKRRTRSNKLFWLAGAVYAYHLADVLWLGNGDLSVGRPDVPGYSLGWSPGRSGVPVLELTRRF